MKSKHREDGIDHINIYSKGKTALGRFLSNFTYCVLNTEDGTFHSIEAYWYWLGCSDPDRDSLRKTHGYKAKELGRELGSTDWLNDEFFKDKIKKAIKIKIESRPDILKALKSTNLPLTHYYEYGSKRIYAPKANWIIRYIETFRI